MDKLQELQELSKPLRDYLRNNYDPYCKIVISSDEANIIRSEMQVVFPPCISS